jgi:hypothetical protein
MPHLPLSSSKLISARLSTSGNFFVFCWIDEAVASTMKETAAVFATTHTQDRTTFYPPFPSLPPFCAARNQAHHQQGGKLADECTTAGVPGMMAHICGVFHLNSTAQVALYNLHELEGAKMQSAFDPEHNPNIWRSGSAVHIAPHQPPLRYACMFLPARVHSHLSDPTVVHQGACCSSRELHEVFGGGRSLSAPRALSTPSAH